MPMMTCGADRTIATTLGHTFEFKANVPLYVPNYCVGAVMDRGAYPAEGEQDAVTKLTEEQRTAKQLEPTDAEERVQRIVEAIGDLLRSNELQFTAGGKPQPSQLSKKVNFQVDVAERNQAWELYRAKSGMEN